MAHFRRYAGALKIVVLAGMAVSLTAPPAQAQSNRNSNVIIDYSVIDELGPAPSPSLPRLLQPGRQPPQPMTAPRAPVVPSPVLRNAPTPPTPPAAPGPIVLQPPVDEPPPTARPSASPKRSAVKPAAAKRTPAKKAVARKAQPRSVVARGPSPPPPMPKPDDVAGRSGQAAADATAALPPPIVPPAVTPPVLAQRSEPERRSIPEAPPAPPASAPRSTAERRFIGDPPPAPAAIPPPPEPVDVARVAPAAGAETPPAPVEAAPTKQPPAAKATATPARTERAPPARPSGREGTRGAVPPPPKIAEPTQTTTAPRQIARAVGSANGADLASAAPGGDQIRLGFNSGASEIDPSARAKLDGIAQGLTQNPKLRLQLLAYAGGTSDAGNQARRLSLSRALSVRSYLMDKGVPSTRIDVRALGNKVEEGGPPDRVDVVVTQR